MRYIRYMIMAACMSVMCSCGLYKKYERPSTEYADSLYNRLPAQKDTASIAEISWQDFFNDPVLKELIETGLRNNTDLSVARLKVEEAEATLMAARGAFLPGVNAALDGGLSTQGGGSFKASVTAGWEADIFGKLPNAKRGAAAALEQIDRNAWHKATSRHEDTELDDILYIDMETDGGIIAGDNPRSVLLAVYEYLRQNGCRWLFPGIDGEFIPMQDIKPVKYRHKPSCRYRGQCNEGAEAQPLMMEAIDFTPKNGMNI